MRRAGALALLFLASCASEYVVWRGRTPDRATDVSVVERGGTQRVVVAGMESEPHRAIGIEGIAMVREHLAYPVKDGDRWSIVRDGAAAGSTWDAVGDVVFAADGAHLAYSAARGGTWRVVVDEVPGPELRAIQHGTVAFDRSGAIVYAGWRGDKVHVVHGATSGAEWDAVHDLRIDADVSYVARDGAKERVVRGGTVSDPWDAVDELVDDGWIGRTGDDATAVVHGKVVARGAVRLLAVGGAHWALARREGDGELVVRDGVDVVPSWDKIESVVLSADGEHAGWIARRGGRATVVVDGAERGTWAWASALRLTRSGAFAYVGSMGAGAVVVTDRGRSAFDVVIEDSLVLSDDGVHWGCIVGYASVRRTYVAIDGRPQVRFDLGEWTDAAAQVAGEGTAARRAQMRAWVGAELGRARVPPRVPSP